MAEELEDNFGDVVKVLEVAVLDLEMSKRLNKRNVPYQPM